MVALGFTFQADPAPITMVGALDRPLTVTFFASAAASSKRECDSSLRDLVPFIEDTRAGSKAALPWLKLAAFGDARTEKGSLRHDGNLSAIEGVEADYDGERMTLSQAQALLDDAGLAAVIYTSPSHTAARPRWRVLCPASIALPPDRRTALLARLNGVLGGVLAAESFKLSQSYYYGAVAGASDHAVALVEGRPIDLATELDAGARWPAVKERPDVPRSVPITRPTGPARQDGGTA